MSSNKYQMNLFSLFEAPVSPGKVVIKYVELAEHPKRGLVTDEVRAFIDGKLVGYLKIDRTSDEIMQRECGNIYAYMSEWEGKSMLYSDEIAGKSIDDFTYEEAKDTINMVNGYFFHYRFNETALADALSSRDKAIAMLKKFDDSDIFDDVRTRWKNYIDFASKPFVAYANTAISSYNGVHTDNRGRGIGKLLYKAAAKWIYERGLGKGLYASSLQSGDAKGIWLKFEEEGLIKHEDNRMYLDGSLL